MGLINKKSILYCLYIILASRASVAGIAPFGPAAYAVALMSYDLSYGYGNVILYGMSLVIGSLTVGIWQQTVISSVAIVIFTISLYFLNLPSQSEVYPI